jgi:hypothetical protein
MRVGSKARKIKMRAKRSVSRNTAPETPDVRARVALDAMKDEAAVKLIKAQAKAQKIDGGDLAHCSASRRHRR